MGSGGGESVWKRESLRERETGLLLPGVLERRVRVSWLRTAPTRATWRRGYLKSVRNLVSFGGSGKPANLEWRDSAEAVSLKERRRLQGSRSCSSQVPSLEIRKRFLKRGP